MGRFVGLGPNRGKGSGGSGTIIETTVYDRNTGITTDSNNNVGIVTLGDNVYSEILYNNVGLVTYYKETIGSDEKYWELGYDSVGLVTSIVEYVPEPPVYYTATVTPAANSVDEGTALTINVSTSNNVPDGTSLYWQTGSNTDDWDPYFGSFTVNSLSGSFTVTPKEDGVTEGSETFTVKIYQDVSRTMEIGESASITINDTSIAQTGQVAYTSGGTHSWTAPSGVTSVCVVCVGGGGKGGGAGGGGGGLGWKNNIAVTPGQSYTVVVGDRGTTSADGGDSYFINSSTVWGEGGHSAPYSNNIGGGYAGDGGGNGGNGSSATSWGGGGGGAGGYSGNGGSANTGSGNSGSGGGGGGGAGHSNADSNDSKRKGGGGGGVGLLGQGTDGFGAPTTSYGGDGGGGGSGGGNGNQSSTHNGGSGGQYGAGSGGTNDTSGNSSGNPGSGAVRIIWGAGRAFPSTNTGDL